MPELAVSLRDRAVGRVGPEATRRHRTEPFGATTVAFLHGWHTAPQVAFPAMSRALVLNATYEPLCVVPSRRAVVLVLGHKADVLHDTGDALHSEHLTVPVPSVIRLRHFVKVPYRRRAPLNRRGVFARDGHRCQYCGHAAESIDHVIPRSRGGEHSWENVVAACRPCNVRKRDRLLHETTMVLRGRPGAPREMTWVVVAVGTVPQHWEPYLHPATLSA